MHINYIEGDLIEIITRCFQDIYTCRKQHYLKGFRADLFIEELGLVVECDEMNHNNRDIFKEEFREEVIKNNFGYSIIRFDPDSDSFNIGDVINKILKLSKKPNKANSSDR